MPKRGKLTKPTRDRLIIAGLRKHAAALDQVRVGPRRLGARELVAFFQAHLDALDTIARYDALKTEAVAREAQLEAELQQLVRLLVYFAQSHFGTSAAEVGDFGVKRQRKPRAAAATKTVAVARRKATGKVRSTMGRRQRKKLKGSG